MLHISTMAIFARLRKFISNCQRKDKYGLADVIGNRSNGQFPKKVRISRARLRRG
jgi:hypothetical protein